MRKFIITLLLFQFIIIVKGQDFFLKDFDHSKEYVLLANPTVHNIQTIQFLLKKHLLRVNRHNTEFVGVYYKNQNYEFHKSQKYIAENHLKNFHLQEITGELNESNIFSTNDCTPLLRKVFENSVGIFFFGGPDIPPGIYKEENTRSIVTDPYRHYYEITFLFHLLGSSRNPEYRPFLNDNPGYLVTGFCLGMQTMNVATGGTMVQDIPEELYNLYNPEEIVKADRNSLHSNYWQYISDDSMIMVNNLHEIRFTANPFFKKKVRFCKKFKPKVVTSHHQAAEKLGKGLEITAVSIDGKVVEALAHIRFPGVFASQFHPEIPAIYEDTYLTKFKPGDTAETLNDMVGAKSIRFHKKYWKYISKVLKYANSIGK
ncbi:MAG: hypothetical protein CR996_01575 [Draconibacterium sp.]|nr:MAG: hypothetical protein CR996_01575 [Draconibacterium sp.]PIF06155.1 MAG: hypothetical protein CSA36_03100 [Draconibacterium sp.]